MNLFIIIAQTCFKSLVKEFVLNMFKITCFKTYS